MYKKTLLSLAVASSVALTGCFEDANDNTNAGSRAKIQDPQFEGKTWPVFNPVTSELPVPNDLIFDSEAGDGSFSASIPPGEEDNPVLNALNNLSGASTVAPAVIRFNGKIDKNSVDSRAFIDNPNAGQTGQLPKIPNPNQNVFLIKVEHPSKEPVRGLTVPEPATIPAAAEFQAAAEAAGNGNLTPLQDLAEAQNNRFDHDVVELDGTSALRIRPNEPLEPLRRYVVVVTDEVKDVNGDSISQSPTYSKITEDDAPALGAPLSSVRGLVNGFWEKIAAGYFNLTNQARQEPLDSSNVAISYSFTTSEDKKVLSHIAEPANWIADQVERAIRTGAAETAVKAGTSGFADVRAAVDQAVADFTPSEFFGNSDLAACDADADDKMPGFQTTFEQGPISFPDQFQCVGVAVKGSLQSNGVTFPSPSARNFEINSTNDALGVSAPLSQLISSGDINVHQGSINLPYYLGTPDSESGAPIRNSSWTPDSALAATIAEATDFPIPQADSDTSDVLNYNFPFPEKQADIDVPLLAITPGTVEPAQLTNGDEDITAIIYQHGITTDRSAALAFGSKLVQQYAGKVDDQVVVFAIDQPLHGATPSSREEQIALAEQLLTQGGIDPDNAEAVADEEFSIGVLQQIDAGCEAIDVDFSDPASIQQGIQKVLAGDCGAPQAEQLGNALSLENTVAGAGSTIPGLKPASSAPGIDSDGTTSRHFGYTANAQSQPVAMDFSEDNASGESGSLFINLTNFLNGRDNLRQGALDLMNLRKTVASLSGVDNNSVYFVGHSLGTQTGGVFAGAVKQSANEAGGDAALPDLKLAGVHLQTPVAGVVRLLENSPSFAPTILGGLQAAAGLTQGDADLETFLNVNQHALDSADPINFASELANSNTLISQVNGDRTTPNAADDRFGDNIEGIQGYEGGPLQDITIGNLTINSFEAPLTGSEALANLMDADNTGTSGQSTPAITRYLAGTHGTPVLPRADSVDVGGVLKDRTIAQSETEVVSTAAANGVFGELVAQTLQLITTGSPATITGGSQAGTVIQDN
jgi:hypothetical protein